MSLFWPVTDNFVGQTNSKPIRAGTNAFGWQTNSITIGSKEDQDNLTTANTCLYWPIMPIIYNLNYNL